MCEDTLTPRNETIPGLVELVTLSVGDEFQAGDTGGTVVWKVNKGSARAVDVLYDGHTKPISIAPSLKVMVRKLAEGVQTASEVLVGTCQDCGESTHLCDFVRCEKCGEQYCYDCCAAVENEFDKHYICRDCGYTEENERVTVLDFESVPESVCAMTQDPKVIELLPIEDAHEALLSLRELHDKEPPKPTPAPIHSPTIRVIRLTADGPKTMPVTVQPPLPTCKFDLTLNAEQIRLLTFDSVKQMFYKGLYFGWTRETFFEVAKAKFPHLKAGQNYESCLAQIRLYHCALKNAGRMQ